MTGNVHFKYSTPTSFSGGHVAWVKPKRAWSPAVKKMKYFSLSTKKNSAFQHNFREPRDTSVRFQDLGLSGLSAFNNPKISKSRKFFWGILWLAALVWCVLECTKCVINFASSPFTVDVKFKENQTMTAPFLTLCPADETYRNPAVSPEWLSNLSCSTTYATPVELLTNCNLSIETLWSISRFELEEPLYRLFQTEKWLEGFHHKRGKELELLELVTIHGVCLMFKMNIPLPCTGMQTGLDIEGHGLTPNATIIAGYYTGVIHSEEEIPLIKYTGTITKGFYAAYGQLTTVALRVQQVIHVNTWMNPCHSDQGHIDCLLLCIENKIIANSKLMPCRLPYMDTRLSFPPCKTADEFVNMFTATQSAVTEASPEHCGCLKPCEKVHYREDYFLTYPLPPTAKMGLYLIIPQCDIEMIEEQLSYEFTSFLSDIGGDLGLFLGMSILSIFEILEVLIGKAMSLNRLFSKR